MIGAREGAGMVGPTAKNLFRSVPSYHSLKIPVVSGANAPNDVMQAASANSVETLYH